MGTILWREDTDWDKPMVKLSNRGKYDTLDDELHRAGLLCNLNGAQLVFVDVENSWNNLVSECAVVRIEGLIDIKNATVKFADAFQPYANHITKRCNNRVADSPPVSVCIGTCRYELEQHAETGMLKFFECRPLVTSTARGMNSKILTVSYMPTDHTTVPIEYRFPGMGEALSYLMPIFPDQRDLITYMWHLGNSQLDPVMRCKSLFLCGPGGSGKSKALDMAKAALSGCCGVLPDGALTGRFKNMNDSISQTVASNRMVLCYDVDLETEPLNESVFKNISGGDTVRVGKISCKTACSLLLATNGLIDADRQWRYAEDSIMRRMMCIEMNVNALDAPYAADPNAMVAKLDLLCASLYVRMTFDSAPLSPMQVLLTMCQSKVFKARQLIAEKVGSPPTRIECETVLGILSGIMRVPTWSVATKAKLISPLSVFQIGENTYIKGLAPV